MKKVVHGQRKNGCDGKWTEKNNDSGDLVPIPSRGHPNWLEISLLKIYYYFTVPSQGDFRSLVFGAAHLFTAYVNVSGLYYILRHHLFTVGMWENIKDIVLQEYMMSVGL